MKRLTLILCAAFAGFGGVGLGAQGVFFPPGANPPQPAQGQPLVFVRGGPAGPQSPQIVSQFDANKDGWLNAAERQPARAHLTSIGYRGRGGRGLPVGVGLTPGAAISPADVKTFPAASFYDESVLRTLFLTFENPDWEAELQAFNGTDVDVAASLLVDGKTYPDVGVRFRGLSSQGVAPGKKHSLNLSIDMAHDNQNVGGYRTLNLLNSNGDPTLMRAVLFLHIAREYIAAPKANFVRVVINGEDWGVYANVQQFNKDLIKENFKDANGARWKAAGPNPRAGLVYLGEDVAAYKQAYELKTKDLPEQWAALMNLTKVLNQTPADQIEAALSPILNIDATLKYLALEVALTNNDGYWTRASDYSLYRDESGKFQLIPHDANETFASSGIRGGGNASLDPLVGLTDIQKPLRSKLLAVPELREKYLGYVRDIASKWLDWNTLGSLVGQHQDLIDAAVKADTKKLFTYENFLAGTTGASTSLKAYAEARRLFLLK
jgi:hypothetical protein